MNKGKLKVVKQEMAIVNVYILGISELKWTGMGEFNSDVMDRTVVKRRSMIMISVLKNDIVQA